VKAGALEIVAVWAAAGLMKTANGAVRALYPLKTTDEVVADSIGEKVADLDAAVLADSKTVMAQKEAVLAQNSSSQVDKNRWLLKKRTTGEVTCVPRPHPHHKNEALALGVDSLVKDLVHQAGLAVLVAETT
jgi:hypothetical protein